MAKEDFTKDYFNIQKRELYKNLQSYKSQIMGLISGNLADLKSLKQALTNVTKIIDVFNRGFKNGYISEGSYVALAQTLDSISENLKLICENYNPKSYLENKTERARIQGWANDIIRGYGIISRYF